MVKTVNLPDLSLEIIAGGIVAGVDEAGIGSWVGPVVAGVVILSPKFIPIGINDSKKLSVVKRKLLYEEILQNANTAVGIGTVEEIYRLNILEATKLAMQRAVAMLGNININMILVDGNKAPVLPFPTQTIIGGDSKSLSIAAASIIAKVTRDRIMSDLAEQYPVYSWEHNAGYGTKHHREAIARYGVTEYHRHGYRPIRKMLEQML